jgi:mannose-1-phosphate guanylyltransferase
MAGGSGTRFWPLSRKRLPKQFLKLYGQRSLLQQAFDRIVELVGPAGVSIITNVLQVDQTVRQLPELASANIVGEPCGRDTAACIGLAAALVAQKDAAAHMIVLAADHLIQPTEAFHRAVRAADAVVREHPDALVTFGIPPTRPATGYGYLRRDRLMGEFQQTPVYRLKSFHEKPDLETAERFLAAGEYYWNSGIFCWSAATILGEIQRCVPALHRAILTIAEAWPTPDRDRVFCDQYEPLKKISIDYAVMEKAQNVFMVEAPFQWDDVGSWLALERVHQPDKDRNVVLGTHRGHETSGCIVVGDEQHLVATIGVRDLIVVHTPDVTLVADRRDEQSVKQLLTRLEAEGFDDCL